jgi:hypothetical protein
MCVQFSKCTYERRGTLMNRNHHVKGNWPDSSEDLLQYLTVHFQIQAAQQRIAKMQTSKDSNKSMVIVIIILIHGAHGYTDGIQVARLDWPAMLGMIETIGKPKWLGQK